MGDDFEGRLGQLMRDAAELAGPVDPVALLPADRAATRGAAWVRPGLASVVALGVVAAAFIGVKALAAPHHALATPGAPAAPSCPRTFSPPKTSGSTGPADTLAASTATAGVVCSYAPLTNGGRLLSSRPLGGTALTAVQGRLRALPIAAPWPRYCANDDGSGYVVILRGSADTTIYVRRTGCQVATDGSRIRQADAATLSTLASS